MYEVGLIGYGAFGKSVTGWLSESCNFKVYDQAAELDSLKSVLEQPIIVLCIPAQYLEGFLSEHQAIMPADALYIDVCSVKLKPIEWMLHYLPSEARIIGTHPLFGPQSAKGGIAGQKIMMTPVRVPDAEYQGCKEFMMKLGLQVIETTAEEHDRAMAFAQGLSHYIGRVMKQMGIPETELATRAYRDLLDMEQIQGHDSDALFDSILRTNPYTIEVLDDFGKACQELNEHYGL